ncbi:MAG: hypothetical protein A2096_09595 [Spirochaetes bacterium GWF1_41_5]|nr:MAG: hypothetical protein A2096_09595 [Spirochaetes bacterium GWF1_41_5]HBE01022.1 hypothetical protein [Spirochaetia bacterium]
MKNKLNIRNIGIISTRLHGTDGVSMETEKWTTVLERMGYNCFFCAGLCAEYGEHNFNKARHFYSYEFLQARLENIMLSRFIS